MSEGERLDRVLDAAYACFTRHGIRRTTMDDIALEAGMSRPAVYQYVRNKNDAYRRLAARLFDQALEEARTAAAGTGSLPDRLHDILSAKLELTLRLSRDSPHAAELLGATTLIVDLSDKFTAALRELLASTLAASGVRGPGALAELMIALTRGLEADLTDPERPRRQLRHGMTLLVDGALNTRRNT